MKKMTGKEQVAYRITSVPFFVLVLISVLLYPVLGVAEETCTTQYRFCLQNRLSISGVKEKNPSLWSELETKKMRIVAGENDAKRAQTAAATLQGIKEEIRKIFPSKDAPELIETLLSELDITLGWFQKTASDQMPEGKSPINLDRWKLEPGSSDPGGTAEQWLKQGRCWTGPVENLPEKCSEVYKQAVMLGEQVFIVKEVIDQFNSQERSKVHKFFEDRVSHWNIYFYKTQFQYVWELMFNRYLDNRFRNVPRDQFGNELGIREPPTGRAILLHPDIGLQYLSNQPKGDRVVPAITFQWLGYQWWNKYEENHAEGLKGVSVVSTIADHRDASPIDLGIMFHWMEYSLAFTFNRGELAVTFNLKIGDRLSIVNKEWEKEIKKPASKNEG